MGYYIGEIVKLRKEFFSSFEEGDYSSAIKTGAQMLKIYKDNDDCTSLEYANDINNLAIVYDMVMMYDKAIKLYSEAAEIREKHLGEKSAALADTLGNWASSCSMKKMKNEAYNLHKRALDIRKEILSENHEDLIMSLYNMAGACEDLKRYEKAQKYYEDAKKKAEKQPKVSRNDYADILLGCARIYEKRGLFVKSADSYENAVEIIKMEEGEKSFYYLSVLLDAAAMCDSARMYEKAVNYYKKAVEIRKKLLDKTHLDFVTSLNAYAIVYRKMGKGKEALEIHKEVLSIIKSLVGSEHPLYSDCLSNMGSDCGADGDYERAEEYFKEALSMKDKESDPSGYTIVLNAYGAMLIKKGDYDRAEKVFNEMLDVRKEKFGEDSIMYADALSETARLCVKKNMLNKAANYFRQSAEIRLSSDKEKDNTLAEIYIALADVTADMNNKDYAIKYCEEGMALKRKLFGTVHPAYAEGLYKTGEIKRKLGMFAQADENFSDAYRIYCECLGKESEYAKKAAEKKAENTDSLLKEYADKDNFKKAVEVYEKAQEMCKESSEKENEALKPAAAYAYGLKGDKEKAEKLFEESRKYIEENYGSDSIEYAGYLKYVGKYAMKFTSFEKGEELLFKAMEILYSQEGENNKWQTEISLFMGESCIEKNKYKKAEGYFKTAAAFAEGAEYSRSLTGLAKCFLKDGKLDEAAEKLISSKKHMEEYTETNVPCYGETVMLLSGICEKKGDIESACRYAALSVSKRRMNSFKGGTYVKDLIKLSLLRKKTGDKNEAASLLKEAAELTKDEKEKAKLTVRCAKLNAELKKYDFAVSLLNKAEKIYEKLFGYGSDERAAVVYDEALLSIKAGNNEEAVLYFDMLRGILKENPKSKFADDKYFVKYKKILEK